MTNSANINAIIQDLQHQIKLLKNKTGIVTVDNTTKHSINWPLGTWSFNTDDATLGILRSDGWWSVTLVAE